MAWNTDEPLRKRRFFSPESVEPDYNQLATENFRKGAYERVLDQTYNVAPELPKPSPRRTRVPVSTPSPKPQPKVDPQANIGVRPTKTVSPKPKFQDTGVRSTQNEPPGAPQSQRARTTAPLGKQLEDAKPQRIQIGLLKEPEAINVKPDIVGKMRGQETKPFTFGKPATGPTIGEQMFSKRIREIENRQSVPYSAEYSAEYEAAIKREREATVRGRQRLADGGKRDIGVRSTQGEPVKPKDDSLGARFVRATVGNLPREGRAGAFVRGAIKGIGGDPDALTRIGEQGSIGRGFEKLEEIGNLPFGGKPKLAEELFWEAAGEATPEVALQTALFEATKGLSVPVMVASKAAPYIAKIPALSKYAPNIARAIGASTLGTAASGGTEAAKELISGQAAEDPLGAFRRTIKAGAMGGFAVGAPNVIMKTGAGGYLGRGAVGAGLTALEQQRAGEGYNVPQILLNAAMSASPIDPMAVRHPETNRSTTRRYESGEFLPSGTEVNKGTALSPLEERINGTQRVIAGQEKRGRILNETIPTGEFQGQFQDLRSKMIAPETGITPYVEPPALPGQPAGGRRRLGEGEGRGAIQVSPRAEEGIPVTPLTRPRKFLGPGYDVTGEIVPPEPPPSLPPVPGGARPLKPAYDITGELIPERVQIPAQALGNFNPEQLFNTREMEAQPRIDLPPGTPTQEMNYLDQLKVAQQDAATRAKFADRRAEIMEEGGVDVPFLDERGMPMFFGGEPGGGLGSLRKGILNTREMSGSGRREAVSGTGRLQTNPLVSPSVAKEPVFVGALEADRAKALREMEARAAGLPVKPPVGAEEAALIRAGLAGGQQARSKRAELATGETEVPPAAVPIVNEAVGGTGPTDILPPKPEDLTNTAILPQSSAPPIVPEPPGLGIKGIGLNPLDQVLAKIDALPPAERATLTDEMKRSGIGYLELGGLVEKRNQPEVMANLSPRLRSIIESVPKLSDVSTSGALRGLKDFPDMLQRFQEAIAARGGQEPPAGRTPEGQDLRNLFRRENIYMSPSEPRQGMRGEAIPGRAEQAAQEGRRIVTTAEGQRGAPEGMAENRDAIAKNLAAKYRTEDEFLRAVSQAGLDPSKRKAMNDLLGLAMGARLGSQPKFDRRSLSALYKRGAELLRTDAGYQPVKATELPLRTAGSITSPFASTRGGGPPQFNAPVEPRIGRFNPNLNKPPAGLHVGEVKPGTVTPIATGHTSTLYTDRNGEVKTRFKVVEVDQPITSHDDLFRENANFPQELQRRDRTKSAEAFIGEGGIMQEFKPGKLGEAASPAQGAPVMSPEGHIESGNKRTIAVRKLYNERPAEAARYKEWLTKNAAKFGLNPAEVAKAERPLLVRERETPMTPEERRTFVEDANEGDVEEYNVADRARVDAGRLTPQMLNKISGTGDLTAASNSQFVQDFMNKVVASAQRGKLIKEGKITQQGKERMEAALFTRAYGDRPEALNVLNSLMESTETNIRNVGKALLAASPRVAALKDFVANTGLSAFDISDDLMKAVHKFQQLKSRSNSITDYLNTPELFEAELTPFQKSILRAMEDNKRSGKVLSETLSNYMDSAEALTFKRKGQQAGFTEELPSKEQLFSDAVQKAESFSSRQKRAAAQAASEAEAIKQKLKEKLRSGNLFGSERGALGDENLPPMWGKEKAERGSGSLFADRELYSLAVQYAYKKSAALLHSFAAGTVEHYNAFKDAMVEVMGDQVKPQLSYLYAKATGKEGVKPERLGPEPVYGEQEEAFPKRYKFPTHEFKERQGPEPVYGKQEEAFPKRYKFPTHEFKERQGPERRQPDIQERLFRYTGGFEKPGAAHAEQGAEFFKGGGRLMTTKEKALYAKPLSETPYGKLGAEQQGMFRVTGALERPGAARAEQGAEAFKGTSTEAKLAALPAKERAARERLQQPIKPDTPIGKQGQLLGLYDAEGNPIEPGKQQTPKDLEQTFARKPDSLIKAGMSLNKAAMLASFHGTFNDLEGTIGHNLGKDLIQRNLSAGADYFLSMLPRITEGGQKGVGGERTFGEASISRVGRSAKAAVTKAGQLDTALETIGKGVGAGERFDYKAIYTGEGKLAKTFDAITNGVFTVRGLADKVSGAYALNSAMENVISREAMNSKTFSERNAKAIEAATAKGEKPPDRYEAESAEDLHKLVKTALEGGKLTDAETTRAHSLIREAAVDAVESIFANDNAVSSWLSKVKERYYNGEFYDRKSQTWKEVGGPLKKKGLEVVGGLMDAIAPFTKIPSNIIKQGFVDYNPLVQGIQGGRAVARSVKAGGITLRDQKLLADAIGKGGLGMFYILAGMMAGYTGEATPAEYYNPVADENKGERLRNMVANREAGSVRIPGTDYRLPVAIFGPAGQLFNFGVDLVREPGASVTGRVIASAPGLPRRTFDMALEYPLGKGFKEMVSTTLKPGGGVYAEGARRIGSFVPAFTGELKAPAAAIAGGEPSQARQLRNSQKDFFGGTVDTILNKLPLAERYLPPKPGPFGKPATRDTLGSFFPLRKEERSELIDQLDRYNIPLSISQKKEGETDAAFAERLAVTGPNIERNLNALIKSSSWERADQAGKRQLVREVEEASRKENKYGFIERVWPEQIEWNLKKREFEKTYKPKPQLRIGG